jgi:septum formation protein
MELIDRIDKFNFILASGSPRRKMILESLGLKIELRPKDMDESYPDHLQAQEIPEFLAAKKALEQIDDLEDNEVLITADTVVWINNHVLNKPQDLFEAATMLQEISDSKHIVYTAVCVGTKNKSIVFSEKTEVTFHPLTNKEIEFYLNLYSPLDKAGAYGIQEFIGYIGIKKIKGDFYNVVGFPVQRFWKELERFLPD